MRIVLLNQTFYPDVVSTAQHASDLAARLATRGHEVTVVASNRAYDDPTRKLPTTETWAGVKIHRVPSTGLGKSARWRRVVDFASFMVSCCWRLVRLPSFDIVIAMTTPPLLGFLGSLFSRFRGGKLVYWIMDLNPDQAIAARWLRETSLTARVLKTMLRRTLQQADRVIVLDRFMKARILTKGVAPEKVVITPPWSHDDAIRYSAEARMRFRFEHGLTGKFVVMYSGNHSPCHPLDTLMQAALELKNHPDLVFCFVGGGSEHGRIKQFAASNHLRNVFCLPYQPLETLAGSLSAADLHVVVMGNEFVGIVHPCKIYNILALGCPLLYVGPPETHVTDIRPAHSIEKWFYAAAHGETAQVVQQILAVAAAPRPKPDEPIALAAGFSQETLLNRMVDSVESLVAGPNISMPEPMQAQTRAASGNA